MLAKDPLDLEKISPENVDREILRYSIQAELDAASLYEQFADMTGDEDLKKVLLDIAKEEKTHIGEFTEMLLRRDPEQAREMQSGREEVEELTGA